MKPTQPRRSHPACLPAAAGLAVCRPRLPAGAEEYVAELLGRQPVHVRLARPRRTKLGDHRPPSRKVAFHRITINDDLNPYAFLTTLLHDIAHVATWQRHGGRRRVKPHGSEWKQEFGGILRPVVEGRIMPAGVEVALARYLENPAARSCSDRGLVLALAEFDCPVTDKIRVEDLAEATVFKAANGTLFRAGRMVRSRRQCFEIPSGCEYRVHGLVFVEPVSASQRSAAGFPVESGGAREGQSR